MQALGMTHLPRRWSVYGTRVREQRSFDRAPHHKDCYKQMMNLKMKIAPRRINIETCREIEAVQSQATSLSCKLSVEYVYAFHRLRKEKSRKVILRPPVSGQPFHFLLFLLLLLLLFKDPLSSFHKPLPVLLLGFLVAHLGTSQRV